MKTRKGPNPSLEQLLNRLAEKQDNQVGVTTLRGRALSRSATNVHLAVAGGIIAVPIANIEGVFPLSASQPDAVAVEVRNPQEIQPLLRVKTGARMGGGATGSGAGGTGGVEQSRDGEIVYTDRTYQVWVGVATCTYTDTDTISGGQGQPDQCDDSEPNDCPADDTMQ